MQNKICNKITEHLSNKTGTNISIKGVRAYPFRKLVLKDFYIEDQKQDTLIFAQTLIAEIDSFSFIKPSLHLNKIELDNSFINLYESKGIRLNYQFLIDSLKNNNSNKTDKPFSFSIKNILIQNSKFAYITHRKEKVDYEINWNDIYVTNLNIDIRDLCLKKDAITAYIHNISLKEKTGFTLSGLKSHSYIKNNNLLLTDLNIKTQKSDLNIDTLEYNWIPNKKHWRYFTKKMQQKYIVAYSTVSFEDLGYFNNKLKGFKEVIRGKANVYDTVDKLKADDIKVFYGDSTTIEGEFKSKGLPYVYDTHFDINFSKFTTNLKDIENIHIPWEDDYKYSFPESTMSLGNLNYTGDFIGYLNNFRCFGNLTTKAGDIVTNIEISPDKNIESLDIKGLIELYNFRSGILLNNDLYGLLSLKTKIDGTFNNKNGFTGTLNGNIENFIINDYNYENIALNGFFKNKHFNGEIKLNDPNINLKFGGKIFLDKNNPIANFSTSVKDARLNKLNFIDEEYPLTLSFNLKADFSGNSIDNFLGKIKFSNTKLTNKRGELELDNFYLYTDRKEDCKTMTLLSDFANMNLTGKYSISILKEHVNNLMYYYIPAYAPNDSFTKGDTINNFSLNIFLKNTQKLSNLFCPELSVSDSTSLLWKHKVNSNDVIIDIHSPYISYNENNISKLDININTNKEFIDIKTSSEEINVSKRYSIYNFSNLIKAGDNKYSTKFMWSNWGETTYSGYFCAEASVTKNKDTGNPYTEINFKPGNIFIADSLWNFNPATITIDSSSYNMEGFKINRKNQYIKLSGKISENPNDSLYVDFNQCNLSEINSFINEEELKLHGVLNGFISIKNYYNSKQTNSKLNIKELVLNKDSIGDIYLNSKWNNKSKKLIVDAQSWINNNKQLDIKGWYRPSDKKINLVTNLNKINLSYIENHLPEVLSNVEGSTSGKIYIYNTIDNPNFIGFAKLNNSSFKLNYTQTSYNCNDTILFRARKIYFKEFDFYDVNNQKATLKGKMDFTNNPNFNLNLNFNNFNLINTNITDNQSFFGKVYASGLVQLKGSPENIDIDISAKSEKNTDISILIDNVGKAEETNFVTFISQQKKEEKNIEKEKSFDYSNFNINTNLEITEDARTQIVLDSRIGDAIKGKGKGDIKLSLDKNGDIQLYGNYNIIEGSYSFTLQKVINKRFNIAEGSTIKWNGDPYKADININAIYNVKTTLHDLIAEEVTTTQVSTTKKVPVSCIMELRDDLSNPKINFSIDFPTLDQQTKSYVESLFGSQDDINKQVLYLLILNKFYTPEYIAINKDNKSSGDNAGITTASELLFNQLSSWLSQISRNVDFGFRYLPKDEISSDEIELALSTQIFNDRITININGNVDMGNNPNAQPKKNNIVGDFDLDVRLNNKGTLRLKAYSHNNEQLTYKSATTTQGVGISYQEEFKKIKYLVKKYLSFLKFWK